jgi:hypothetical protein
MKHLLNTLSTEEKNSIREQHKGGISLDTSKFKKLTESKLGNSKPLVSEQGHTLTDFDYERMNSGEDMTYTPYKSDLREKITQLLRGYDTPNKDIISTLRSIADEMESSGELKKNVRDRFRDNK